MPWGVFIYASNRFSKLIIRAILLAKAQFSVDPLKSARTSCLHVRVFLHAFSKLVFLFLKTSIAFSPVFQSLTKYFFFHLKNN